MIFQESDIRQREEESYRDMIRLYLTHCSVDRVFRETKYNIGMSYPGLHHLLRRWGKYGIVKSVGPNSILSETLTFLTLLTEKKVPLETLYKNLPLDFITSATTLHRVLHNIKEGVTRRYGTALIVFEEGYPDHILVGRDKKHKALTLPMTYSGKNEDSRTSILRVLQQEVFAELAVDKYDLMGMIDNTPELIMNLTIADIKVRVRSMTVPAGFLMNHPFSSYKVDNLQTVPLEKILGGNLNPARPGVIEITEGYKEYLLSGARQVDRISNLNLALSLA